MPGGSVNGRPFRESSDSYENTGIPCGNPKRFRSHDVVRMEPGHRTSSSSIDGPVEEIETEGQRHLQTLLRKQMDSKIPLQQYIHRKKVFSKGVEYNPVSKETSGMVTLDDFKVLEKTDGYIEELKACGLTSEEILYKLQAEDEEPTTKKGKFINAEHEKMTLMDIERRIQEKKVGLDKPDTFSNVKTLSRHDMDLEKTLSAGNQTNAFLHKVLIQEREKAQGTSSGVMSQLPEILASVSNSESSSLCRRKGRRKQKRDGYKLGCTLECCVQDEHLQCESSTCDGDANGCHIESSKFESEIECLIPSCAEKPEGFVSKVELDSSSAEKPVEKNNKPPKSSSFSVSRHMKCSSDQFQTAVKRMESCGNEQFSDSRNKEAESAPKGVNENQENSTLKHGDTEMIRLIDDVEGIPDNVITQYKLTSNEVKQILRFENYSTGEPSNVLYVKNLSPKLSEKDLAALFINFQKDEGNKIVFKLLTGRMKGQAFVTFPDTKTASQALQLVHGYQYKGKPVVIQYGKKTVK